MLQALMITTLAGISTGIGGLVVLLCKRPQEKMMAFSLGFAAGVMITVSLVDMLPHAVETYAEQHAQGTALLYSLSLCLAGMGIAWALERCVPAPRDIDEAMPRSKALRSAMVTTMAIVLHNLPEGIITMFTGYANPAMGITLALAIALHNIPEGIAIAVPVYYATGSRARGALYALFSGLAEPFGALIAFGLLWQFLTPMFLNGLLAIVAGIMLYVSFHELLPESFFYKKTRASVQGLCVGTLLMSVGIYLV